MLSCAWFHLKSRRQWPRTIKSLLIELASVSRAPLGKAAGDESWVVGMKMWVVSSEQCVVSSD